MKNILVLNSDKIARKHKNVNPSYEYYKQEITNRSEFSQCYAAFYEVLPNKSTYPFHYHEKNTELFYIIEGEGVLRTNTDKIIVTKGDVIVCPPGAHSSHKLTNISNNQILRYLDVATTNSPDTVHYPDSNKIGIITHNESATFYLNDEEVDYYTGE